jgi:ribosomal protein S18 acetylase RimI-like enzyme
MRRDTDKPALAFRTSVRADDRTAVRAIVESTRFFSGPEVDVAEELVAERIRLGEASGYLFIFAEEAGEACGYTCYGEIPCTVGSYDLYWIAVRADLRGRGIGRELMARAEADMTARGGRLVFVETSGRPEYDPTRRFYEASGYSLSSRIPDFYAPGDDKIIYGKRL